MTRRKVKVVDLLCGAGGTSSGAEQAIAEMGLKIELTGLNHWPRAIETFRRNHPKARAYCQDIATARPLVCVPGGALDLLMASPTCTHHSRARGSRPTSDQQRSDPWHITPWLTELRVGRLLFENVAEWREWGPVSARTKRPIKAKKGQYFDQYLGLLDRLGFDLEHRVLVCANFGDPTTRERLFVLGRHRSLARRGIKWPDPTHAKVPANDQLPWRSARECIDWDHRGTSIYTRAKPLQPMTLLRIYSGLIKFGWPARYVIRLRRYLTAMGVPVPLLNLKRYRAARGAAEPFGMVLRQHMGARSLDDPTPAIMAAGGHLGLVTPFVLAQGEGGVPRNVTQPMPTILRGGAHALIAPYYGGGSGLTAKSVDSPLDTVTTLARFGLIEAVTEPPGDDDILYRMLQPPELAWAMSLSDADREYDFAGNKTEVTRQIGGAVPRLTAAALVKSALWDLAA